MNVYQCLRNGPWAQVASKFIGKVWYKVLHFCKSFKHIHYTCVCTCECTCVCLCILCLTCVFMCACMWVWVCVWVYVCLVCVPLLLTAVAGLRPLLAGTERAARPWETSVLTQGLGWVRKDWQGCLSQGNKRTKLQRQGQGPIESKQEFICELIFQNRFQDQNKSWGLG